MQRQTFRAGALISAFLVFTACAAPSLSQHRNDLKWVTESVEYAALCIQTYRNAWESVRTVSESEDRNWVVVLDVDETVLDNSRYALERAAVDSGFTARSWAQWVLREEATLIPGAKEFIDKVRTLGPKAHIAYVTNRDFEHEQATVANLKQFELFQDGDTILTRRGRSDTKVQRRRCLETGTGRCAENGPLVILALFGDNIRDFMEMEGKETAERYRIEGLANDENWGRNYFVLPNPTYGSWERDYR